MSVITTHYIVLGVAITDKIEVKKFFEQNDGDNDLEEPFHDNGYNDEITPTVSGIHIIVDGMCGKYVVIGKILYKSQHGFDLSETMGLDVIKDFKSYHEEVGRIIEQISKVKNIFNIEFDPNNLKHLIFTQWH